MAKTVKLLYGVHLSEKFGGIKHGEDIGDIARGEIVEFKSDKLAEHLISAGLAEAIKVEKQTAEKK